MSKKKRTNKIWLLIWTYISHDRDFDLYTYLITGILICVRISNTFDHHITYLKLLDMDTSQIVYVHLGRISNILIHVQIMYAFLRYSKFYTHSEPTTLFFFTFSLYVVFLAHQRQRLQQSGVYINCFFKKKHTCLLFRMQKERFKSKRNVHISNTNEFVLKHWLDATMLEMDAGSVQHSRAKRGARLANQSITRIFSPTSHLDTTQDA